MTPDLTIYRARNGWTLEHEEAAEVVEDDGVVLLWVIADVLGITGTRYDAKRLFITYKPGDKHHDYHPLPCSRCECACDPDQSANE